MAKKKTKAKSKAKAKAKPKAKAKVKPKAKAKKAVTPKAKAKPVVKTAAKVIVPVKKKGRKSKMPTRSTPTRLVGRRRNGRKNEELLSMVVKTEPKKRSLQRGGLSKSDLGNIKKNLIEQRQLIVDAMRRNQGIEKVGADVGDEADQAGLATERELQFELSDNERTTLDQIEGALRKMEKGTFGNCEQCRLSVETLRIKALPFARYCIQCQNTSEKATATLL